MRLAWDRTGERFYETGVDQGVLYLPDGSGNYNEGHAWNGLTTVTETPAGAESNKQYADNIAYLNLLSAETFGGTIEAFTYPDEFGQCDGTVEPQPGVSLGQQGRRPFGLAYRTKLGNDTEGQDHGYKIHLIYGALAQPSEKAYASVNDSPEAISFSWDIDTTPVNVAGHKPTSLIVINSKRVDPAKLSDLEDILYGTADDDPRLPLPDEVIAIFGTGVVDVDLNVAANQPTFNNATGVVTIPAVAGVVFQVNGEDVAAGAQPAIAIGDTAIVEARAADTNHNLVGDEDWAFERTA
jgi:hypothetical protein